MNETAEENPERTFQSYRDAFRREIQRLTMFIAIYRYLHERHYDRLDALNVAPAFFQTILIALKTSIVVAAHSLLVGGTKQEFTTGRFLHFVTDHLDLFTTDAFASRRGLPYDAWQVRKHEPPTVETIREDRKRIATLTAIPSLRVLRNKFHAHLDPQYFLSPETLADDAPLRWGDVSEILEVLCGVLNRYSVAFDGNHFVFEPTNMLDVEHVIAALDRMTRER